MYSGTTLTKSSGRVLGTHQKIDRVARNHLQKLLADDMVFPAARRILRFEGKNGPDAIKRKSPARDEPWHYFNPFDDEDTQLIGLIEDHYAKLVQELRAGNKERSAFEAAWLAHALVDGLTPAHHYPYEEKLAELRGEGIETRTTVKAKLVMPGDTRREKVKNNWLMWKPRGLLMGHSMFEFGVATMLAPMGLRDALPRQTDIQRFKKLGLADYFRQTAREIAAQDLYHAYQRHGWTPRLAWKVRHQMGPSIVKTVTLAWYMATQEAGLE